MFTGKWLHEHGQNTQIRKAGHNYPLLAEILKEKGYYNLMVTSNVVVTDIFGINKGFDETIKIWKTLDHQRLSWALTLLGYIWRPRLRKRIIKSFVNNKMAEDIESLRVFFKSYAQYIFDYSTKRVEELLKEGKKIFLFINLYDMHFPYHTDETFKFETKGMKNRIQEFKSLMDIINNKHMRKISYRPNIRILEEIKNRQIGSFKRVGRMVDEFSQWLRSKEENSTIVFSSDHGENFGEEKWLYHFANVTEGGNRVPLTWSSPGQTNKSDIDIPVSLKHTFNSFLKEAGVAHPEAYHLKDNPERSSSIIEAFWYDAKGKTAEKFKRNQFAFLGDKDKYIFRNENWYKQAIGVDSPTGELDSIGEVDPIRESGLDPLKKAEILKAWERFKNFEKTVKY
jgi:arylsulfatase A-like enzyme